ncbi:MAG TPA: SDR family oxidoreductase [Actinomycetota bacterium]|jgi:3-oxoacyl-[acyl-carrier protein] reductase|nr:SDR family oxidoreductase [Actinomycetota bacterium]
MDLGIEGKVALVTGSTSGLGLASAKALAAEGASVVVCGRRGDLASEQASALPKAIGVQADLTDPAAPQRLVDATIEAFGRIDILVGSTGGPTPGPALGTDADAYDGALDLLVKPMVRLAHLVVPGMQRNGWGRLVFVTSSVVREPVPILVLSNSVRMAVHGFAKTLAKQIASDGITVNCVMPGNVRTDRTLSLAEAAAAASGRSVDDVLAETARHIPAGRSGDPAEFGAVVAFLCSEQAAYVNGASIPVDGAALSSHW